MTDQVLHSAIDASTNFIANGDYPGLIEARYVQRSDDYFIVYLSSQTGCAMRCRMCHLTQTGQLASVDVDLDGYVRQALQVLAHYDRLSRPAKTVHFNFMARGEVFANRYILGHADELVGRLGELASERELIPSFKFSTIMPRHTMARRALTDVFKHTQPDVYYSLYSLDPAFRARWLPNALDPMAALEKLIQWQDITHKLPVLHWAFIAGENDGEADIEAITSAVARIGLRCDFNIVRYNPFDASTGIEPDETVIQRNANLMRQALPWSRVQVVPRVGYDVKASCGMFVAGS